MLSRGGRHPPPQCGFPTKSGLYSILSTDRDRRKTHRLYKSCVVNLVCAQIHPQTLETDNLFCFSPPFTSLLIAHPSPRSFQTFRLTPNYKSPHIARCHFHPILPSFPPNPRRLSLSQSCIRLHLLHQNTNSSSLRCSSSSPFGTSFPLLRQTRLPPLFTPQVAIQVEVCTVAFSRLHLVVVFLPSGDHLHQHHYLCTKCPPT